MSVNNTMQNAQAAPADERLAHKAEVRTIVNFTVNAVTFATAATNVARIISNQTTLPILRNVLILADENGVTLHTTDLETTLTHRIAAEVATPGDTTIDGRLLANYLSRLDKGSVQVERKGATVHLRAGKSTAEFPELPPEDFPPLPSAAAGQSFPITGETLRNLLAKTIYATAAAGFHAGSQLLSGVLCEITSERIRMVTTDGYRLAIAEDYRPRQIEATEVILTAAAAKEIARYAKDTPDVNLSFLGNDRNHLRAEFGDVTLTTRLIDGQYPKYEKILPTQHEHRVHIDTEQLRNALNRLRVLTTDRRSVTCTIAKDEMILKTTTNEIGNGEERIPCELHGEPLTASFRTDYLLDAINHLEGETLTIETLGPLAPTIIRNTETDKALSLVMPTREN